MNKNVVDRKFCRNCRRELPASSFHKHSKRPDGLQDHCKECRETWRKANPDRIAQHGRSYRERHKERARQRQLRWAHSPVGVASQKRKYAAYKNRFPERIRANHALQEAVAAGKIHRGPCAVCGAARTVGHHENYSAPLEVVWLCHRHHAELHRARIAEGSL